MFSNYLKVTLRNFRKSRLYTLINIFGLATGLTCCLLILLYIQTERSFDTFHENAENIYRMTTKNEFPDRTTYYANTPFPLAPQFKADYPEAEAVARVFFAGERLIEVDDRQFYEEGFAFADADFLKIFTFPIISGEKETALTSPRTILLTESFARKYFGTEDPIGKVLRIDNQYDLVVNGIMADVPANSHMKFNVLASFETLYHEDIGLSLERWGSFTTSYSYMRLAEGAKIEDLQKKSEHIFEEHSTDLAGFKRTLLLTPLLKIHFDSPAINEIEAGNTEANLWVIATIGLFILLIACFNFMNLATARSMKRAREVGVRKVVGAGRNQLIFQFLGESFFMVAVAWALALIFAEFALPYFSALLGVEMALFVPENISLLIIFAAITIAVGVLAGSYPALYLSAYRPIAVLKGGNRNSPAHDKALQIRKVLVTIQFSLSIMLIIGTFVVVQQLSYMQNAGLGFTQELIVNIPIYDTDDHEPLRAELLAHRGVRSATASMKAPIGSSGISVSAFRGHREEGDRFYIDLNFIDGHFMEQFDLQLLAGRDFANASPADTNRHIIVNEAALKELGISNPADAVGHVLPTGFRSLDLEIVGVVKDYHTGSLHGPIKPLGMMHWSNYYWQIAVQVEPNNLRETMTGIEGIWSKYYPQYPFRYTFLDEFIAHLYSADEQVRTTLSVFSVLAILIASLGLLGLTAYAAEQRTREIGIRKVLGATVTNILALMSKDFLLLITIAGVLAGPLSYFLMNHWLQSFAYRIEISWFTPLSACVVVLVIALATTLIQTLQSASINPVEALRSE